MKKITSSLRWLEVVCMLYGTWVGVFMIGVGFGLEIWISGGSILVLLFALLTYQRVKLLRVIRERIPDIEEEFTLEAESTEDNITCPPHDWTTDEKTHKMYCNRPGCRQTVSQNQKQRWN